MKRCFTLLFYLMILKTSAELPDTLIVGTGEYTTGYVHDRRTGSDKKCGVAALTFFDLRGRGKVGKRIALCGVSGQKLPAIRTFLRENIEDLYSGLSSEVETFPSDEVERDSRAYIEAIKSCKKGDICIIFTPDDTHMPIAMEAVRHGMHVMVTKPAVKTLADHKKLIEAAREAGVLVAVELHKRYDPIYSDAVNKMQGYGDFGFFSSYMSQPKSQLQTFKKWAGRSSDISYYLNSHHIDLHDWAMQKIAYPTRVTAAAAKGLAEQELGVDAEDTITLAVEWQNLNSPSKGLALYTASWAEPLGGDVFSEQNFLYMGHSGKVKVDQAHRGATECTDSGGHKSFNPLYMRYTPDSEGRFCGQQGYGYQSFEKFVDAVNQIRRGEKTPEDFDGSLPTIATTLRTTAILEAGRLSLDNGGLSVEILYDGEAPAAFRIAKQDLAARQ